MTLQQSKFLNTLFGVTALFFFIMSMVALNQRDEARKVVEDAPHSAASLVVVVILALDRDALTIPQNRDYAPPVTVNPVAGIGVPIVTRPHRPRIQRGFFVRAVQHPSYGGLDGGLFGGAGFLVRRYANAVQSPALIGVLSGGFDPSTRSRSMANPTQVAPVDLIGEAYDAVTLSAHTIAELGALFRAIYTAKAEPTMIHRLAGIGQYLADDHAASLEHLASELSKQLAQSKGTSTASGSAGRVSL